jgi:Methylase involved in ubiquinone/menaquinone biosynthesis
MGKEINLLIDYPRTKRDTKLRSLNKSIEDQMIARKFDKDFFDGDRRHGYGGFKYHPKYWQPVIPTFIKHYNLSNKSSILDVGCAKGFMIYDFIQLLPGLKIKGIDISEYAIKNSLDSIKENISVADACSLPFDDNTFDLVISITTIHNLEIDKCKLALQEIERVSKLSSFITVDAYNDDLQKEEMLNWNLTAKTILHVEEWKDLFEKAGYTGDYYWFMP